MRKLRRCIDGNPVGEFLETYRGEALAWEADDLGHLNMRFYFARAGQATNFLFAHLNLPSAYKAGSFSTAIVKDHHIKYLAEIRPGRGMVVKSGIAKLGTTDMTLVHMIYASPDTLSATIIENVSHISRRTRKPFPWPSRVQQEAKKFKVDIPDTAIARNIDPDEKTINPSVTKAEKLGLTVIGRGAFVPTECGVFGYVRPYDLIGRVSDSVKHLAFSWPDINFDEQDRISGALLEVRVIHHNRPVAGDSYIIRSGLQGADAYVRNLCHWILDPVSGKCWASMIGTPCKFDLQTRRMIKNDDKTLALLKKNVVKGLGI